VIYKAYLDEANTGTKEPRMIIAGFLGTARQWRNIEAELKRIKRREGFASFHAVEFKAKQDDFHGWSDEKCMSLINALARIVREGITEAVSVTLPYDLYNIHYRNTPFERKMPVYSQYGVCLYTIIEHLIQVLQKIPGKHHLDLIVEDGHKNAGAAREVFKHIREYLQFKQADILGTVILAKKKECELLMMADFQAHASGMFDQMEAKYRTRMQVITQQPTTYRSDEALMTNLSHNAISIQTIKERFTWLRNQKMAAWHRRNRP
jgi:hypothetical protein